MTRVCELYGVTRAGFYAWRRRPVSARAEQDQKLGRQIATLFTAHRGRYGSPRIHRALAAADWRVSRRRVERLKVVGRNCHHVQWMASRFILTKALFVSPLSGS